MSGVFGFYSVYDPLSSPEKTLSAMSRAIKHRGPDDTGTFISSDSRACLGSNRLSIIDIKSGKQPFCSDDMKVSIVKDGVIFNNIELIEELLELGVKLKTGSDIEIALRMYEYGGIKFLDRINGMFSIAIYDQNIDSLFLVRDRVGEKPLYWCNHKGNIFFASEIKSILEATGPLILNNSAIDAYLTYNYVPPPITMFNNVHHVKPGHRIIFTGESVSEECWWDVNKVKTVVKSESEWAKEFYSLLDDAVRIRMRSDVQFGAFLSGGVDSSTVVGMMSKHIDEPVKTFNIGFSDPKYDESHFALDIANRFGCDHYSEVVESNLLEQWSDAIYYCDQPHGDVSFLPTKKVSDIASREVKMVLTGDGADELFAGYDKYKYFFSKFDEASNLEGFRSSYADNITLFKDELKVKLYSSAFFKNLKGEVAHDFFLKPLFEKSKHMDLINQALYIDVNLLLPGNNLVKPDRMGMAHGIENRAPFLDCRVIEQAFRMPGKLKLFEGETKYIYKKSVSKLIGHDLTYRKKQMFTVPVGDWFKTTLKPLCDDLLLSEKTRARELFDYTQVEKMLNDHCSNTENYTREIRALMALEIWFRRFDYAVLI